MHRAGVSFGSPVDCSRVTIKIARDRFEDQPVVDRTRSANLVICCFGSFINIVAMTVFLPFLPAYINSMGHYSSGEIYLWSSGCYAVTFLAAALLAPVWGRLADRFGSRFNLIRASCGMFVFMSLTAFAHSAWQLLLFRALVGLAGGYTSGAAILVAQQTRRKSGFAQGLLASSVLLGSLAGPALGGLLAAVIGMREVILVTSALIFVNVIATLFLSTDRPAPGAAGAENATPVAAPVDTRIYALLVAGGVVMVASISIEPIIYTYVSMLRGSESAAATAGLALSAMALGSVIASSAMGYVADRIGYERVLAASFALSALILAAHAFIHDVYELVGLRFMLGLAIGGALPCIRAQVKNLAAQANVGRIIGWSTSAQYAGQVAGPVGAGIVAARFGIPAVFFASAAVTAIFAVVFLRRSVARLAVSA